MLESAARHGGIVRLRLFRRRVVIVADPDLAQEVLVARWERYQRGTHNRNLGILGGQGLLSTEGEPWRKRRRQMQPAFRRECLERLVPAVAASVGDLLDEWDRARGAGKSIALGAGMLRLAMSAMGRMLLSAEIAPAEVGRLGRLLQDALSLLRARNTSMWPAPLWLPTPANRRLLRYRDELTAFVEPHIRARRRGEHPPSADILTALLELRDPDTGEPLSDEALIDETKTLFVAGFETTATALTWTLYLLARHPDIAANWHREVDAALAGATPTWHDLARLPYTSQILYESMRLYPPVYAIGRRSNAADELGGYEIPAGTPVLISIYGVHRAPVWGSDAAEFRPARFDSSAGWPKRAYMPFATGPHLCIGNDFAMVEMTVALALIAQRYRLSLPDDSPVGESARITLVPDREIFLKLEPR